MVMVIYQNFLVVTDFSCGTNSDIHYQIKALVAWVKFFINIMVRKVIKNKAH